MSWDDFLPSIISVFCPQYNTIRSTQNQNFVWLGNVLKQKVKLVSDQASSGQCSFLSCYRRLSWSQRQRGCWASRWYHLLWLPLAWTLQEGAPEGIGMEVFIMGWVKEVCLLVEPPLPTTPKKQVPLWSFFIRLLVLSESEMMYLCPVLKFIYTRGPVSFCSSWWSSRTLGLNLITMC